MFLFVPLYADGDCGGGSAIIGGTVSEMTSSGQPQSTLHRTYPTPLVIKRDAGNTCLAAELTTLRHGGSVTIDIKGFVD